MSRTFLDGNPRMSIPCPRCGKESLKPLSELIGYDKSACDWCEDSIRLDTENWQAKINKFTADAAEIYISRP